MLPNELQRETLSQDQGSSLDTLVLRLHRRARLLRRGMTSVRRTGAREGRVLQMVLLQVKVIEAPVAAAVVRYRRVSSMASVVQARGSIDIRVNRTLVPAGVEVVEIAVASATLAMEAVGGLLLHMPHPVAIGR